MLHIFRKYQQYIYIVITFVIVLSFSFFGTYGTINERSRDEGVAFTAYNGTSISNVELNEYERFFASDNIDKLLLGGAPGPNFLNDGVIAQDILQKQIAFSLFKQLEGAIGEDTRNRFKKEKHFQPYKNPKASFLSAENTWSYFVPEMSQNLSTFKNAKDPFEESAFQAKVALYLGQRKAPPHYLKQILQYQQRQYGEQFFDPELPSQDLALFGYRNLEEWFGPKFIKALSAYIINASMIAEEKGYVVTKEEAQADLMRLAMQSFKENQQSPYMTASNVSQYFTEHLNRMQMDQSTAIKIWQRALLFKRYMQDTGGSVFIASIPFQEFNRYVGVKASGTLFALPEEFRLRTPKDFEMLEVYLDAISSDRGDLASLPKKFKTTDAIAKSNPELVQNRYVLEIAKATENDLLSKIGLKEVWRWQVQDNSWKLITKQFPELGQKTANTIDDRQKALDALDNTTRQRINVFSKKEMLKANPEITEKTLKNAEYVETIVTLSATDEASPLAGISNKELLKAIQGKKVADEPFTLVSKDGLNHYLIILKEAKSEPVVLTFVEAKKSGALDKMLKAGDEDRFAKTIAAVKKYGKGDTLKDLFPYRLVGYVKEMRDSPAELTGLAAQWKLEESPFETTRSSFKPPLLSDTEGVKENTLSDVFVLPEGDVYFFTVKERGLTDSLGKLSESALLVQNILGSEAEKALFNEMLKKMVEKDALNLSIFHKE